MKIFDQFLARFNIKLSEGTKTAIIIIVGLILAFVGFGFLESSWEGPMYKGGIGMGTGGSMPSIGTSAGMPMMWQSDGDYAVKEEALMDAGYYGGEVGTIAFSSRNAASIYPPQPGSPIGNTAEQFEVSDYSASIETTTLENTCAEILGLKGRTDVIFESANQSDSNCFYSFKVEHAAVESVLSVIRTLNPKNLSENTYTIKQQLDDFTSEEEILKKKLTAIEDTLEDALDAYDDVARLAAQTNDAEALARVVSSKVSTIERLTQERINVSQQLQYLARAKEQQADKLNYAFFAVSVYENEYIDGEALADSWKAAVQRFFYDANNAIQGITITLIALVLWAVQYLLYFLMLVAIVKYGWKIAKFIWKQ